MELAEYRAMRDIDCLLGPAVGEGEGERMSCGFVQRALTRFP